MESFRPDRSLLNPKFEGYKLDPIPQENAVLRYELQYKPTQSTSLSQSPLSFEEVRSRITHNHLCISSNGERALYVDADYNVIVIDVKVNQGDFYPEFTAIYELPRPIISPSGEGCHHPEYPSAAFLSSKTAFVSDGHGYLYVLDIAQTRPARLLGQYRLPGSHLPDVSLPFRIHEAVEVSADLGVVLVSLRNHIPDSTTLQAREKLGRDQYEVCAVQFTLPIVPSLPPQIDDLDILWRQRGEDVPVYTAYDKSRKAFLLIGSSVYRNMDASPPPHYEPSSDELAPIPRQDESFNAADKGPQKPPPYSWTQTSDSVTVAFPLPSTTPKSSINITFSAKAFTCHIQGIDANNNDVPRYSLKPLWDGIFPSSSFWTWDREAEHSFGLLTLHLDKQHEGTKWMHVFEPSTNSKDADEEVLETLDPSELWHIRESLEKYTRSLRDGEDMSGLGLGKGVPSLAEGEMDEEVDDSVGRTVYLTWVGSGTTALQPSDTPPFTLLSTILPGSPASPISLVVKNHIDGTMFHISDTVSGEAAAWNHTATFSALGFVLASKQDTRFTYHFSSKAVLAFENGSGNRGGNVYIYGIASKNTVWAKQVILKVGDASSGSLLGVGALKNDRGDAVLLCLTEGHLVLIHNIAKYI